MHTGLTLILSDNAGVASTDVDVYVVSGGALVKSVRHIQDCIAYEGVPINYRTECFRSRSGACALPRCTGQQLRLFLWWIVRSLSAPGVAVPRIVCVCSLLWVLCDLRD